MVTKSCTKIFYFSTRFSCQDFAVEDFGTLPMGKNLKDGEMLCLGMVSTNLFRLFYAGEIQNLNCRTLEMATYAGIFFFTRECTQTPTYVEVLPSFAHCRWMNTNTALQKYASPARIRYSNKVLYTMFRTAHRLCSDVFFCLLAAKLSQILNSLHCG